MSDELVKWRLFFVWEDDQEERWLEEMARSGWHLVKGGLRFVFQRGKPAEMRYRLDWRRSFPGGKGDYLSVFRDAGWEYVCDFKHWHYFRSFAEANAPEIHTDAESHAEMYTQLQWLLAAALFINAVFLNTALIRATSWILPLQAAIVALLVYGVVRLHLKKKQIRATGVR